MSVERVERPEAPATKLPCHPVPAAINGRLAVDPEGAVRHPGERQDLLVAD